MKQNYLSYKNYVIMLAIMLCVIFCAQPAFAFSQIGNGIRSGVSDLTSGIQSIVDPLALVVLAISGYKIILGSSTSAEEGRSLLLKLGVGLIVIHFAAPIANLISVSETGWGGW